MPVSGARTPLQRVVLKSMTADLAFSSEEMEEALYMDRLVVTFYLFSPFEVYPKLSGPLSVVLTISVESPHRCIDQVEE